MSFPTTDSPACERIAAPQPVLIEKVVARDALPLAEGELGHAGPPFASGQSPPPVVLGALIGAVLHEGWAPGAEQARRMILDGTIRLRSNHSLGVVSPMAGVVRPGQALFRVLDQASGESTFATLAEKGQRVLRFGAYGPDVAEGLRQVEGPVAAALAAALPKSGLPLLPLIARAVELGDDVHQRNIAGMLAFLAALGPLPTGVRDWLATHPQFFLNFAMAAAKLCLDAASGTPGSAVVTAISRNGIDCGVQVAGLPGRWFRSPASLPLGGFFAGRSIADAHADLGDSAIMETFGLGGCLAHASPEIARTMGRDWDEARCEGAAMRALFAERRDDMSPALAGADGVGLGLDARAVAASGRGVRIHTGIAHRDGESGWVGIGVAEAPLDCFAQATRALDAETRGVGIAGFGPADVGA